MTADMTPKDDRDPRARFADDVADDVTAAPDDWPDVGAIADDDGAGDITEPEIRGLLSELGKGVGAVVPGRAWIADAWAFTDDELDALTPPVTRIINRRPALRALAHKSDPLAVAFALGRYSLRNVAEIADVRRRAWADSSLSATHVGHDFAPAGMPTG